MGPISTSWYKERNLTRPKVVYVDSDRVSRALNLPLGTRYEVDEVTEHWAGGRIDIYGLDESKYYCGKSEYSLPVMHVESWNKFSDWLDEFETPELVTFKEIVNTFEFETGHKILWWTRD